MSGRFEASDIFTNSPFRCYLIFIVEHQQKSVRSMLSMAVRNVPLRFDLLKIDCICILSWHAGKKRISWSEMQSLYFKKGYEVNNWHYLR